MMLLGSSYPFQASQARQAVASANLNGQARSEAWFFQPRNHYGCPDGLEPRGHLMKLPRGPKHVNVRSLHVAPRGILIGNT